MEAPFSVYASLSIGVYVGSDVMWDIQPPLLLGFVSHPPPSLKTTTNNTIQTNLNLCEQGFGKISLDHVLFFPCVRILCPILKLDEKQKIKLLA